MTDANNEASSTPGNAPSAAKKVIIPLWLVFVLWGVIWIVAFPPVLILAGGEATAWLMLGFGITHYQRCYELVSKWTPKWPQWLRWMLGGLLGALFLALQQAIIGLLGWQLCGAYGPRHGVYRFLHRGEFPWCYAGALDMSTVFLMGVMGIIIAPLVVGSLYGVFGGFKLAAYVFSRLFRRR